MTKGKKSLDVELEVPEGIEVKVDKGTLTVKGPKGEISRRFVVPYITLESNDKKLSIKASKTTKREKKQIGTLKANIKNMFKGAAELHKYQLKVCSGHFPMKVDVKGDALTITNFLGEKHPRVLKLNEGVTVKVDGDNINVESIDKRLAGQTSANIEQLTRRTKYDTRIFQDGIYIINKDGKEIK